MMLTDLLKAGAASALLLGGTALLFQPASANAQDKMTRVQSAVYGNGAMVTGSGQRVAEVRSVSAAIRKVIIEDATDLEVRQGREARLGIETDANIIDMIHGEIEGDTLKIVSRGSYQTRLGVKAFLTLPRLDAATVHGSGDVDIIGWRGDALRLQVHGSGDIALSGVVDTVEADVHGSGDIELREARIGHVDAEVAGSGDIRTGAPRSLSAVVYGSGDIHFDGSPRIVKRMVHGTGAIYGAP